MQDSISHTYKGDLQMEKLILDIEPCMEIEIDCFHNLQMMFLKHHGFETKYIGAIWPWQFEITESGNNAGPWIKIENAECMDKKKLNDYYGLDLNIYWNDKIDEAWPVVRGLLDKNIPVFAGLDQYYVHYHYPHIYGKEHGMHTTLAVGYSEARGELYCVSEIPRYKGSMSVNEFERAVEGNKGLWYSTLPVSEGAHNPDDEFVWERFLAELKDKNSSCIKKDIAGTKLAFTKDIIDIMKELSCIEDDGELSKRTEVLCEGVWGWHVDRRGQILKEYLKMPYVKSVFPYWEKCIKYIDEANKNWIVAYRSLFKGLHGSIGPMLDRTIEKLSANLAIEDEILSLFKV